MSSEYLDFIVSTSRFNLSEVKPHFINDCCFGEDMAAWLAEELAKDGFFTDPPEQEDWGWCFALTHHKDTYFFAISGDNDGHAEMPNQGEWRISIHKTRSVMDRLMGRNRLAGNDPVTVAVERILVNQPDMKITDIESSGA